MTIRTNKSTNKRSFDHEILVLQGGGALGAYHAVVFEGLVAAGRSPTGSSAFPSAPSRRR